MGPEGREGSSPTGRWARLAAVVVRCPLRRGAWYPVVSLGPDEVVLEIRRRLLVVPKSHLEIVDGAPTRWTLVNREWGGPYAVCPNCAERIPASRELNKEMFCTQCNGSYEIERDTPYARRPG